MKCDELKAEQWLDYSGEPMPCYPKAKVDAAIAELKQKLQDQCISCPVKMQEDDVVAELKQKLEDEIAELKDKLREQTSIAEEGWKEFRTYHTSYAEAVKELYDKNKEIAELKEKHKTEVKELLCLIRDKDNNFNRAFDSEEKEIRHQKYKRCLAMARECINGEIKLKRVKMRDMNDHQFWQFDNDYWLKWNKRWLKIAEQFKEAK